jgi:hypothetical protein
MLKNDPFTRQQSRIACNQQANDVRNTLYIQGRKISAQAHKVLQSASFNRDEVLMSLGEITAYMQLRKALSPTIAMDQFTQALSGLKIKLRQSAFPEIDLSADAAHHDDEQAGFL